MYPLSECNSYYLDHAQVAIIYKLAIVQSMHCYAAVCSHALLRSVPIRCCSQISLHRLSLARWQDNVRGKGLRVTPYPLLLAPTKSVQQNNKPISVPSVVTSGYVHQILWTSFKHLRYKNCVRIFFYMMLSIINIGKLTTILTNQIWTILYLL